MPRAAAPEHPHTRARSPQAAAPEAAAGVAAAWGPDSPPRPAGAARRAGSATTAGPHSPGWPAGAARVAQWVGGRGRRGRCAGCRRAEGQAGAGWFGAALGRGSCARARVQDHPEVVPMVGSLGGRHRRAPPRRRRRAVAARGSAAEAGTPAPVGSPCGRQGSPGAKLRSRCPRAAGPEVGRAAVREAPSAPQTARREPVVVAAGPRDVGEEPRVAVPGLQATGKGLRAAGTEPRDGRGPQVAGRGLPEAWRRPEGPWLAGPWGPPDPGRRPPAPGVAHARERRPVRRRTSARMREAWAAPVLDRPAVKLEAAAPGPDRVMAQAGRLGNGHAPPGPCPPQPLDRERPSARQRPTPPPAPSPLQRPPPPEAHLVSAPSAIHGRLGNGGRSPGR